MRLNMHDSLIVAHQVLELVNDFLTAAADDDMVVDLDANAEIVSWSNGREQGMAIYYFRTIPARHFAFGLDRYGKDIVVVDYTNYNSQTHLPSEEDEWEKQRKEFKEPISAAAFIAIELAYLSRGGE